MAENDASESLGRIEPQQYPSPANADATPNGMRVAGQGAADEADAPGQPAFPQLSNNPPSSPGPRRASAADDKDEEPSVPQSFDRGTGTGGPWTGAGAAWTGMGTGGMGAGVGAGGAGSGGPGTGMDVDDDEPAVRRMHRFTLYETSTRYYIVGSDLRDTHFRILKLDRTADEGELSVTEDGVVYTRGEMTRLLATIEDGNRAAGGLRQRCPFWGLLGFIRFTGPHYMLLITKRSVVAMVGGHYVYQVEKTVLVPLTSDGRRPDRNPEEARFVGILGNLDLTRGFYFSYSYDITRTLQHNIVRHRAALRRSAGGGACGARGSGCGCGVGSGCGGAGGTADCTANGADGANGGAGADGAGGGADGGSGGSGGTANGVSGVGSGEPARSDDDSCDYNAMFVWNHYLLEPAKEALRHPYDWCLPVVHGHVDQATISVYGRAIYITLVARRSRFFAGARFLKRGANDLGYVANDVETEQIVSEMLTTSFHAPGRRGPSFANPHYTSFVQHRGSIPLFWTQKSDAATPKPPVELNLADPFFAAAALHFDDLFARYGAPLVVLNLVKARERLPRESLLLREFGQAIAYLNQFLPPAHHIRYIAWDMSRAAKSSDQDVIATLETIAENVVAATGFFHNGPAPGDDGAPPSPGLGSGPGPGHVARMQNGVCRTNCIDCLDRTNAAQFVIGKRALGHQLHALGVIATSSVDYDSDAVDLLTHMYHDHGDTIAVQYAGSHLVNTMETYRKINMWSSHSRDVLESFKRYYNNSFLGPSPLPPFLGREKGIVSLPPSLPSRG